jgi:acyl-CoA hydrolase
LTSLLIWTIIDRCAHPDFREHNLVSKGHTPQSLSRAFAMHARHRLEKLEVTSAHPAAQEPADVTLIN